MQISRAAYRLPATMPEMNHKQWHPVNKSVRRFYAYISA